MDEIPITYNVRIHDEGPEGLWADVAEMPGCFASGQTHEELREALAEAIGQYLSAPGSECRVTKVEFGPNEQVEERKILISN